MAIGHHDIGKAPPAYTRGSMDLSPTKSEEAGASQRKNSVVKPETLAGEIYDERYESTQRGLKSRHAQMIALGGTIGTGLFVGSGQALARGGPAFILGTYIVMVSFTNWTTLKVRHLLTPILLCLVLPHLVHRHGHGRILCLYPNQGLFSQSVRMALCQSQSRFLPWLAVLLQLGYPGPIRDHCSRARY